MGMIESGTKEQRGRDLYRKFMTVRRFEEKVDELFRQGKIPGTIHVRICGEGAG